MIINARMGEEVVMKTITIELLVDDSEAERVRERILYFLTDELGYEEDVDFIF